VSRKIASILGAEGVSVWSFESMSKVTRPEIPKAVVWYRLGNVILHHRRISIGARLLSVELMNLRCSFVRTIRGSVSCEDEPEAYPDSRFEEVDSRWTPILTVGYKLLFRRCCKAEEALLSEGSCDMQDGGEIGGAIGSQMVQSMAFGK
jgi:hypothetical protein